MAKQQIAHIREKQHHRGGVEVVGGKRAECEERKVARQGSCEQLRQAALGATVSEGPRESADRGGWVEWWEGAPTVHGGGLLRPGHPSEPTPQGLLDHLTPSRKPTPITPGPPALWLGLHLLLESGIRLKT